MGIESVGEGTTRDVGATDAQPSNSAKQERSRKNVLIKSSLGPLFGLFSFIQLSDRISGVESRQNDRAVQALGCIAGAAGEQLLDAQDISCLGEGGASVLDDRIFTTGNTVDEVYKYALVQEQKSKTFDGAEFFSLFGLTFVAYAAGKATLTFSYESSRKLK